MCFPLKLAERAGEKLVERPPLAVACFVAGDYEEFLGRRDELGKHLEASTAGRNYSGSENGKGEELPLPFRYGFENRQSLRTNS